jgi:DNA invertase Pin-like site-specific DNA recombinase
MPSTTVEPETRCWSGGSIAWGRSVTNLIELLTLLDDKGIGFKSLTEQFDITTSGGKLVFHIFGALESVARTLTRAVR